METISQRTLFGLQNIEKIKLIIKDFDNKKRFIIPQCTDNVKGIEGLSYLFLLSRSLEDFLINPEKIQDYGKNIEQKLTFEKVEHILEALEQEKNLGYQNLKKLYLKKLYPN